MTSIRRRILLPLVPTVALLLAVAGLAVESAARRELQDSQDRRLLALVRGVGSALDVDLDGTPELELREALALEFRDAAGGAFYRVSGPDGAVLYTSGGLPTPPAVHVYPEPRFAFFAAGETRYRVCTLALVRAPEADPDDVAEWRAEHPGKPLPEGTEREFWVEVGLPTAPVDRAVAALRARLAAVFGALFLGLALVPAWIVSRALRPLRDLSRDADRVGPREPGRRLGGAGVDREVAALVAALNRALDRLAEAWERQQRFTADAAHELRTPLATLRAGCEVTLRRERSAAELREALEGNLKGVLRMAALVEDLLALSRMEQESEPTGAEAVDLAQLARDAAAAHRAAADAKGVRLDLSLAEPVPARGNPGLLTECVSNLVGNAVRHTPPGGTVTVEASAGETPAVRVRDTGAGIPEEHRERIFERFYRVDGGRSRGDGGAGLGLALVREIARLHGGRVEVASRVGAGSCFTLTLPAPGDGPVSRSPGRTP